MNKEELEEIRSTPRKMSLSWLKKHGCFDRIMGATDGEEFSNYTMKNRIDFVLSGCTKNYCYCGKLLKPNYTYCSPRCVGNAPDIVKKMSEIQRLNAKERHAKTVETNLSLYGVTHCLLRPEVQSKVQAKKALYYDTLRRKVLQEHGVEQEAYDVDWVKRALADCTSYTEVCARYFNNISKTLLIDYSQGNSWDSELLTMDDFHKPAFDEIGFQELPSNWLAWWSSIWNPGTSEWDTPSVGKQPAWIHYMTEVNKTYGNFAIQNNEMFMTLNRRYEFNGTGIEDLTTYIDPAKYNFIFAETSIDAMNFWVQIAVDYTYRAKMSGKLMPNL